MKYDTCICCGNNDKNDYLIFNYSKICSMNYPEILDNSNILYCKQCSFSFCENQFDDDYLNLYYSKYYNGKSIKSDSHSNNFFIRNLFYDQRSISQITFLNQFLNLNNIKILDIGSGSAIFFLQLNRVGLQNVEKYIIEPQIKN